MIYDQFMTGSSSSNTMLTYPQVQSGAFPWEQLRVAYFSSQLKMVRQGEANLPDSKVHEVNTGPTWVLSAPGAPHVGIMNLAVRALPGTWENFELRIYLSSYRWWDKKKQGLKRKWRISEGGVDWFLTIWPLDSGLIMTNSPFFGRYYLNRKQLW